MATLPNAEERARLKALYTQVLGKHPQGRYQNDLPTESTTEAGAACQGGKLPSAPLRPRHNSREPSEDPTDHQ